MTGERSDRLDPEVKMALRVRRVVGAPTVTLVLWAPLGRRASSACQDFQATLAGRGRRVQSDSLDFLVPMERKGAGARRASQDHVGNGDLRVQGAREDPGASQGNRAPRATLVGMARLALRGNGDPMDPKDPQASQESRAPLAPQARTGFLDTQDREERLVSKARRVPQDRLVWWGLRAPLERRVRWVSVATLGPQGPQVNRGSQA